jgi:putative transposase
MFACPDTVSSRPASRKPSCCGTARTPGSRENLAVEQHAWWRPGRRSAPGYLEQCRQLKARETDRRRDWCEKTSTGIARRFDVIRVEDLKIRGMTRSAKGTAARPGRNVRAKAGLNRGISRSAWGLLVRRLEDKAPGRVERVPAAYTSLRCSACGHVDGRSRESQARFRCTACGHAGNADVNAARSIAAGHAVKARRGDGASRPVNREPQLLASQRA